MDELDTALARLRAAVRARTAQVRQARAGPVGAAAASYETAIESAAETLARWPGTPVLDGRSKRRNRLLMLAVLVAVLLL
jgi:hypothetical protein